MKKVQYHTHQAGFTLVEVFVTIVIAALFVGSITQLYIAQTQVSKSMTSYSTADLLSQDNLRTYAYGASPSWFECTYVSSAPQPMILLDSTADVSGIQSPVIQSVIATAPYGCGGSSSSNGYPIKVVSKVTYGKDAKTVVHATYSTY
ncbi:MAG: hypothetical protein JWO54_502 [Candidatus Saccharibacteria bacterium]|nr:hypothetical protein [Candidatus Saccharibacteria bacterium]MDB5180742.1 hypothetical protein [Candidatus Saccharibacteria bacterium]